MRLCSRRSDSGEREREKNICSERARPPHCYFFLLTSLCAVPSIWTPGTGYFSLGKGRERTVGTRLNNTSLNCDAWKHWRPTNVRPFKFVFFAFPIQTTWSSPGNFISMQTCPCIGRHLKETVRWSTITWSEMGKQNIQVKSSTKRDLRGLQVYGGGGGSSGWEGRGAGLSGIGAKAIVLNDG